MNKVPIDCYVTKNGDMVIRFFNDNNVVWFKYQTHWFWGPRFVPIKSLENVVLEMHRIEKNAIQV